MVLLQYLLQSCNKQSTGMHPKQAFSCLNDLSVSQLALLTFVLDKNGQLSMTKHLQLWTKVDKYSA